MSQIQWFPGHMAKAKREAIERIKLVDIVIELVDARIPESSRNPVIHEIIGEKPSLLVLNKADLADSIVTQQWLNYYHHQGQEALAIDAQHNKGLNELERICQEKMADFFQKQAQRGVKPRPIRLMILGIPNVGKSTLINRMVGKNRAQTGNRPGVTKALSWLKVKGSFELLDTPGILWPKFEDPEVGKKLAITGAIKDSLLYMDDLALKLLDIIKDTKPDVLIERYRLTTDDLDQLTTVDLLMKITQQMGLREDYEQASERLIFDFRQGRLGALSLDTIGTEAE